MQLLFNLLNILFYLKIFYFTGTIFPWEIIDSISSAFLDPLFLLIFIIKKKNDYKVIFYKLFKFYSNYFKNF
jgi:hypothetical protein